MGGKHTPGPWLVRPRGAFKTVAVVRGVEGGFVVSGTSPEQEDADAHLIAAAPDLLKELEHLVRLLVPLEASGTLNIPGLATLNGARAAISKARGTV